MFYTYFLLVCGLSFHVTKKSLKNTSFHFLNFKVLSGFCGPGFELRASHLLSRHSPLEPLHQPRFLFFNAFFFFSLFFNVFG
jgi:hypothetical protein